MGKKAPDPPDMTPVVEGQTQAAEMSMQLAREQMAWAKEQDGLNRQVLDRVLGTQEMIQYDTFQNARQDRSRYENTFQPLEDNLIQEFQSYDSAQRRDQERGRAFQDVSNSFDAQRRNALQRLESYGVDPSQTRNAALDLGVRTQQAMASAAAGTNATRSVENTGRALRAEAINIGKGMPSNVAASYGQSIQAGNSQVGNAGATTGAGAGAYGAAGGALGNASSAYGAVGNTMNQSYQNQLAAAQQNSSAFNGVLGAAGMAAGMMMADGGDVSRKRKALTIDNDTGSVMFDSQPGHIDYGAGDGSGIDDQVPINASQGEYIIPADVVRAKGVEFFDKLVDRYHVPAEEQREDAHTSNIRSGRALNPSPRREMSYGR